MPASVNVLKERLRDFLHEPSLESEFRVWFAHELRNAHKSEDMELESLLHTVQRAFSDAAAGRYSPAELTEFLTDLSAPVKPSQVVPFHFSGSCSPALEWQVPAVPTDRELMLVDCK